MAFTLATLTIIQQTSDLKYQQRIMLHIIIIIHYSLTTVFITGYSIYIRAE